MFNHKTVDLASVRLHYVEAEGPGVPVLLLHAALDSWESYHSLIPEFTTVAHVYALDFRGHGQSSHTPGDYKIRSHVQDLHQFIQQVVAQPVILVGHSLGGFVATWYASRYPNWVQALVDEDSSLLEIAGVPMPQFAGVRDFLLQCKAEGKSLEEFEQACAQDIYRDSLTRLEIFGWATVRRHARQRWQMDPTALNPLIDGTLLEGYIPEEFLPVIQCPTYLVHRLGQEGYVQKISALIPKCSYTIIATDDHRVHETQPAGYLSAVKRFIQSIAAATP